MLGFGRIKQVEVVGGVTVSDVREDRPRFKRRYEARINEHVTMTLEAYTFCGRNWGGELNQVGGKWVRFDPKSPADKILDREILPIVERYCQAAIAMDRAYVKSSPSEFTDEDGVTWQRRAK